MSEMEVEKPGIAPVTQNAEEEMMKPNDQKAKEGKHPAPPPSPGRLPARASRK